VSIHIRTNPRDARRCLDKDPRSSGQRVLNSATTDSNSTWHGCCFIEPISVEAEIQRCQESLKDPSATQLGENLTNTFRSGELFDMKVSSHRDKVSRLADTNIPTRFGHFRAIAFRDIDGSREHLALTLGDLVDKHDVLTRIHSECLTGDALYSLRCDCGLQLRASFEQIAITGIGVIIYLGGHEGRSIGKTQGL